MARSSGDKITQARMLYVDGGSADQVAHAMDVSESTVYRWRDADKKRGVDWDKRRAAKHDDPQALLALLERRRQELAKADPQGLAEYSAQADALQKLGRAIEQIRDAYGDFTMILNALRRFAQWAVENMSDDDREVIFRGVEAFTDDIKRSAR